MASGTALLCALPAVIAALPVPSSAISAPALRDRILASAGVPYEGYAESTVNLGLPELPDLHNVSLLLDGTTDQYVWYRSPAYWRADDVTGTGESDTYADGGVTYLWSYGTNLLTQVTGAEPVRLPRAADLLPPALARRLLDTAGRADRISRLPDRRIAGVDAAGLQLVPTGSATTVGSVQIWADPASGLPVQVQITGRGTAGQPGQAVLLSTFLELSRTQPDLNAVTPHPAPNVGLTTTRLPDVDGVLNGDGDGDNDGDPFPPQLGGLRNVALPGGPPGVAIYGSGLSRFVLLPLPRQVGTDALNSAIQAGADSVALPADPRGPGGNPGRGADPDAAAVRSHGQGRVPPRGLPVRRCGDPGRAGELSQRPGHRLVALQVPSMIVTRGLTKRYGHLLVVDHVDLDVREGDRYGFLGPNGSGKTTVVRMLLGLVYATSGEITVLGQPVPKRAAEVLPSIGALVEGPSAYGHLSGRANLALIDAAGKSGRRRTRDSRIAATLDRVGLGGIDNRPVKRYSLGMRQRLGLAAALLRTPKLLILDEPTNGLDPQGIREIRDLLIELNAAGTTVFLSSHQLSEVEQLCTRVGIVNRGRLVRQDDLETLRALTGRSIVHTPDTDRAREVLDGQIERAESGRLVVADADTAALNSRLVAHGVRVTEIAAERRSLEDVVLSVTGSGSDRVDAGEGERG